MFLGSFSRKIDEKSRFYIPKKFKKQIGQKAIVIKSVEGCLCIYSPKEFKELSKKMEEQSLKQGGGSHNNQRSIGIMSEEVRLAGNRRILLSLGLMDHALLRRGEVLILGAIDHFEVWNPKVWEKSLKKKEDIWPSILSAKN